MQDMSQPQSGYVGSRTSPIGLGGAVAVHAVAFGIFLLMPKEVIDRITPPILTTYEVPDTPPPDPVVEQAKPIQEQPLQPAQQTIVPPVVNLNASGGPTFANIPDVVIGGLPGTGAIVDPLLPPRQPVFVGAKADYAKGAFQPAYPPSMRRQDLEGKVTVRIRIGADGRVLSVDKLFATTEAFWEATQEQALKKWRFQPATSDGTPVETVRELTVYFKLEA